VSVHLLSTVERAYAAAPVPNPAECRAHFAAGRVPVYHGRRLVAYVDRPDDLPAARFVERHGRTAGLLDVWEPPPSRSRRDRSPAARLVTGAARGPAGGANRAGLHGDKGKRP
jgi:hypothetical protein